MARNSENVDSYETLLGSLAEDLESTANLVRSLAGKCRAQHQLPATEVVLIEQLKTRVWQPMAQEAKGALAKMTRDISTVVNTWDAHDAARQAMARRMPKKRKSYPVQLQRDAKRTASSRETTGEP